ncbi:MAG: hypothetical protein LUG46_01890, partial [Erysipelotrichaceae bacterium]|nr:hypothetical protein [Erysipelotrichaceae bacterium]
MKKLLNKIGLSLLSMFLIFGSLTLTSVKAIQSEFVPEKNTNYAIVTSNGTVVQATADSWTTPMNASGTYKNNKVSTVNCLFQFSQVDGYYVIEAIGLNDGVYVRYEGSSASAKYLFADTRKIDANHKFQIIASEDGYYIYSVNQQEYMKYDSSHDYFVGTTNESEAELFTFIKNPSVNDTTVYIQNVDTGKLVSFANQSDDDYSAIDVNVDLDNITNYERFIPTYKTNSDGISDVVSFASVGKSGYQIASSKWVDGAVACIGSYKGITGGWEAIAVEAAGNGYFYLRDAALGTYVTVNDSNQLDTTGSVDKTTLTDREKFVICTYNDIAACDDLSYTSSATTSSSVTLTWTNPLCLYTDIYVYQKASNADDYTLIDKLTTETSYTVNNLNVGTKYSFKLVYISGNGDLTLEGLSSETSQILEVKTLSGEKPDTPANVTFDGNNTQCTIKWDACNNATHYQILRADSMYAEYEVVKTVSKDTTSVTLTYANEDKYSNYYKVVALNSAGDTEEDLADAPMSEESEYVSLETQLFGRNVVIFAPTDDTDKINERVQAIFALQNDADADAQFNGGHYSIYYKAGDYTNTDCVPVGFYTQVAGLGKTPYDVKLNNIEVPAYLSNNNATCNFWRTAENLSVVGTDAATTYSGNVKENQLNWSVAQAAPLRRIYSTRNVSYDWNYGWASGGYTADCYFTGNAITYSGQQYFTRNSIIGGTATGTTLNNFNIGVVSDSLKETCTEELTNGNGYTNWSVADAKGNQQVITSVTSTPSIKEKPFLFIDDGEYKIFVPSQRDNASGISWSEDSMGEGTVMSLDEFYIAKEGDSAATINEQLANGMNIFFTPGVYSADEVIQVTQEDTIILGTGMPTITADNSEGAMKVADKDGISVSGLLFDAGKSSEYLMTVGEEDTHTDHSSNPMLLQDLFFRIGGTTSSATTANDALIINSDDVICDHFWIWRADHGAGVSWSGNAAQHGLIVNGDNVTCYALFNEHFEEYTTLWNGENGATYFYQNETAYDPISQEAWMSHNGTVNGYASYKVANNVENHYAIGLGIYNVFIYTGETYDASEVSIQLDNAIEVPNAENVLIENACLQTFANEDGAFQIINSIVNGVGYSVSSGESEGKTGEGWSRKFLISYNNGTAVVGKDTESSSDAGKFLGLEKITNIVALGDDDIDTETLQNLYDQVKETNKSQYTETTFASFSTALTGAAEQLEADLKYAYQSDFDEAYDVLLLTYKALEEVVIDKDALQTLYNQTKDLDSSNYTTTSFSTFSTALSNAKTVLDNSEAKQTEVDNAYNALNSAIDSLETVTVNTSELNTLLNIASVLSRTNYTSASYSTLTAAIEAVEVVLKNPNATQAEIDAAYANLIDALAALEISSDATIDESKLQTLYETANILDSTKYTSDSYAILQKALETVENVLNDNNATQEEIDAAFKTLNAAVASLQTITVDKTKLQSLINSVTSLDSSKYTSVSYKALQEALETAQKVLDYENATQDQIDSAYHTLSTTITG